MYERKEIDIIFDPITITRYMDVTGRYETETYTDESLSVAVDKATKKLSKALARTLKISADEAYGRAARYVKRCASFDDTIDVCNDLEYQLLCKCFLKGMRNRLYKRMDKDYGLDGRKGDYVFSALEEQYWNSSHSRKLYASIGALGTDLMGLLYERETIGMAEGEETLHEELRKRYEEFDKAFIALHDFLEGLEAKREEYEIPSADTGQIVDANRPDRNFKGFVF